jgi:protein-disulfide isomerase
VSSERQQRAARAEQMRKEREKSEKRQRNVITLGIVTIIVALIVAAAWAVNSASDKRSPSTELVPPKGATKDYGVVYGPKDIGEKPADDLVRVVLYEDMQCPVCQAFEAANGKFLTDLVKKGEIEIEYRFVSFLDDLGRSPNEYSHRATNAVLCAREEGGAKQFKMTHDLLYANQPEENTLGPEDNELLERVVSTGVKRTAVESCILKQRFVPWINDATKQMDKQKVTGTPTVRINGKDVTGAAGPNGQTTMASMIDIQKAIDAAKKG